MIFFIKTILDHQYGCLEEIYSMKSPSAAMTLSRQVQNLLQAITKGGTL